MRARLFLCIFISLWYVAIAAADARRCLDLFQSQRVFSYQDAKLLLGNRILRDEFTQIKKSQIKDMVYFNYHPDYGDGSEAQLYLANFKGKKVIIKYAGLEEARLSFAMSELGIGPRFFGVGDFCDCYIMEFVPDAIVIKANRLDRRIKKKVAKGFRLSIESQEKIIKMLRSLESIGYVSRDPNFLVKKDGEVFYIDPDPNSLVHETDPVTLKLENDLYINRFRMRFEDIKNLSFVQ